MPSTRQNHLQLSVADVMARRRDMIGRLTDAGLPEDQAAAEVDALCVAARERFTQDLARQIIERSKRRDAALDWITRDSLGHQLRALTGALACALGNPQDTKTAHGYVRQLADREPGR
ncbi:hypothetical protein C9F11_43110 (plasmid) [Streptomyces sp. YIM 121038]|uniref:hypothetical protein n=1 Tax=Streptomyces sp. YIM 121038 TaxID=2136401 RepID=UPI00111002AE|nr:hypothetical protein [Streptomyces sp. YIM 121038]QCX82202.1 hypothetical protein C9F11_43110 [Streptomyces sp. YIM 121038]